jgi:heptosyltransferase-1
MASKLLPSTVESILLVRLSARGDVTFASALIPCLRKRFPEARLGWVVEEASSDLVSEHPDLDEVILLPRGRWRKMRAEGDGFPAREMAEWIGDLRDRRYQVAIDLQGLLRSGLVTWFSGASVRIGLGSKEGSRLLMTHVVPRDRGNLRRVSSEYHWLAEELGLRPGEFPMSVHLAEEDRAGAQRHVAERGLDRGFVALCPFTTRPQKHWTEEGWVEVAREMTDRTGLPAVFLGGPGDREAMDRITAGLEGSKEPGGRPGGAVDLVGRTSLGEAAALVALANGMVGVDTGLTHLSISFRTPTVALFGSTTPYLDPPNNLTRIVYHRLDCSPCETRPTCGGAYTCMRMIEVGEVRAALAAVMAGEPASQTHATPPAPPTPREGSEGADA